MVKRIRTLYPCALDKGSGSKFRVGPEWQETPNENQRVYQLRCCEYNNEDEDNIPNTLKDKNYQASSKEFRQIIFF